MIEYLSEYEFSLKKWNLSACQQNMTHVCK